MNQLFDAITWNLNGIGIEQESFRTIDAEAAPEIRARFSDAEWHVARRLVHTTADFAILDQLESGQCRGGGARRAAPGAFLFIRISYDQIGLSYSNQTVS
ncbi:MAG: precorrin-8X methylmutase [Victivallales bacterium]